MYTKEYSTINKGTKGAQVIDLLAACDEQGLTRKQIADQIGCTVARVGEVVRALGTAVRLAEGSTSAYIVADHQALPERVDHRSNHVPKVAEPKPEAAPEPAPVKKTRAPRTKKAAA